MGRVRKRERDMVCVCVYMCVRMCMYVRVCGICTWVIELLGGRKVRGDEGQKSHS